MTIEVSGPGPARGKRTAQEMNMMAPTSLWSRIAMAVLTAATVSCNKVPVASFAKDVHPILQQGCQHCHRQGGEGFVKSGFSIESYESIMRGTRFGPVIEPGSSVSSTLVRLLEQKTDPTIGMPRGEHALSPDKIALIRNWIDQGAKNN
jgi:hypothetical protein